MPPRLPDDWDRFETVDAHAAGEPLRVVTDGVPPIPGDTILERRRYLREHLDHLRTAICWEPRGHADMYGAVLTDPVSPEADHGVLFLTNEGYSTMCGHGIIALATVLVETGMHDPGREGDAIGFDTPAGLVTARVGIDDGRVEAVTFENVPSFVYARDRAVSVPDLGEVRYDVAYGGAFYAYCDAAAAGVPLRPERASDLADVGMRIKRAVAEDLSISHPSADDLGFLYGTILAGPPEGTDDGDVAETRDGAGKATGAPDVRNVCVFADGQVDRSPTGTGVSGHLAIERDRGRLSGGEAFAVESLLGTTFTGRIARTTTVEGYDAVVPEITGRAHLTGRSELVVDPADPLGTGFRLG